MSTVTTAGRRSWAYRLISRCSTPPPSYGSPAWLALPEGDVAKIAAVVIAAECWARDGDNLPERLAIELDSARHAFKQAEDAEHRARAAAHRTDWGHLRVVDEPYAERRARELETARPKPDDYAGRGA